MRQWLRAFFILDSTNVTDRRFKTNNINFHERGKQLFSIKLLSWSERCGLRVKKDKNKQIKILLKINISDI